MSVVPPGGLHADNKMATTGSCLGETVLLEQSERGATVEWKMTLLQETTATGGEKIEKKVIGPHCVKTCLQGFRPGSTQYQLYNHING